MHDEIQSPHHRDVYTIKNNGYYFMTGVDGQGKQVLMGLLFGVSSPEVVEVIFDESGDYVESVAKPIIRGWGESDEAAATRSLVEAQGAIGLTPATISIRKFWWD